MDKEQYPIVCISGSMKFFSSMMVLARVLTLQNKIVLMPLAVKLPNMPEEKIQELDKLHLAKIDLAETLYVVSLENYIGESTSKEIQYARFLNKHVVFVDNPYLTEE